MQKLAHDLTAKERTQDVTLDESVNFDSLLLSEHVLTGLKNEGFIKPSPIQLKAIPLGKCGFDLIVQSKSGTGKTAVFTIIALEMIDLSRKDLQVLVVAPTREIAVQIQSVFKTIGQDIKDLNVGLFIGGLSMENDIKKAKICQVAVGTPGRLKSLFEGKQLNAKSIRLFVMDEADKLIESNLQGDINFMYHKMPKRKQTLALSATYTPELQEFLERYMQSPTYVSPVMDNPILLGLKQFIYEVKTNMHVMHQMKIKTEALIKILTEVSYTQCLVFTNYQVRVESVCNSLTQKDWPATFISGAQPQAQRLKALNDLKNFKCRILLTTDLTARGIDAGNVDLIINYDIPTDASTYLHRMGRAGRYGSKGICINIATASEIITLQEIYGSIGGVKLSIPKLPKDIVDIWNMDVSSLEHVNGVKITSNERNLEILNSVLSMKEGYSMNSCHTSETMDTFDSKFQDKMEKECEERDTTSILEALATGDFEALKDMKSNEYTDKKGIKDLNLSTLLNTQEDKETSQLNPTDSDDFETIDILTKIASGCENVDIARLTIDKKRKRDTDLTTCITDTGFENIDCQEAKKPTNQTVVKNVALLNLTKLLVQGNSLEIPEDLKSTTSNIIKIVKDNSSTKIMDSSRENRETNSQTIERNVLEMAYDYALDNCSENWIDFIDVSLDDPVKDLSLENLNIEDSCKGINLLEPAMFTRRKSKWRGHKRHYQNKRKYIRTKQTLKERNAFKEDFNESIKNMTDNETQNWCQTYTNTQVEDHSKALYYDYSSYFDHYEKCLSEYVDKFEDVTSFQNWFVDWQNNLEEVRGFVQQNLYLQEMSRSHTT